MDVRCFVLCRTDPPPPKLYTENLKWAKLVRTGVREPEFVYHGSVPMEISTIF